MVADSPMWSLICEMWSLILIMWSLIRGRWFVVIDSEGWSLIQSFLLTWNMKKPHNIYQSQPPNVPQKPNVPQPTSWRHGEAIVILTTINERKRIWDDMWLCPRCGTANPKYMEKMVTRKLSGKHHRTNIMHISQRMGIIVIVVAAKHNPNCTPSNIKKIWTWQSQTDEISTIFGCSDEGPTQPGHPVLSKGASKATAADDQIRWALAKFEKRWVYLKMDYSWISQIYSPLAILLAFSDPGALQASNFIQDA